MAGQFQGFDNPEENWSKLPHALIDLFPWIQTVAELKIVLYVLRHTWGFQEYGGEGKRITLDEFSNGRKRRDGSRLDSGTGLTRNATRAGIRAAIADGFLIQESDGRDAACGSYKYRLRMAGEAGGQTLTPSKIDPQCIKDCPPEDQTLTPSGAKIDPRSEKETLAANQERETPATQAGAGVDASLSPGFQSMLTEATTALELVVSDTLRHQLADAFQADPERIPGLLRYARAKGLGAGWFRKAALEGTRAPETPPGLQRKALVHADGSEEIIFLDSKGRRVQTFDRVGEDGELHSKPADILDWTNDDWRDVGGGAAMLAYQIHKRFDAGELDADEARERLRQCYRQELETRDRWHIHG